MKKDYTKYTDKELVELSEKGKKEFDFAFKIAYTKYAPRVHAYCMKVLNNREDAEDVFQETFVKFYERFEKKKRGSSIQGFLITIARNLCLNYKRDKKTKVEFEDFRHYVDGDKAYDQKENLKLIRAAIELLEFEYREPLILKLYDGLKYEEIAEICEISVENARKRVFRAKQKIRKILEPNFKEYYERN